MPERDFQSEADILTADHPLDRRNQAEFYVGHFLLRGISQDYIETASDGYKAFENIAAYYAYNGLFHKPTRELYEKHFRLKARGDIEEYLYGRCAAGWEQKYGKMDAQEMAHLRGKVRDILDGKAAH